MSTEPYTEYRIIVIAFTLKHDGEPSEAVIQRTDIAGPTAPQIINLTCHSQDAIYLQWKRPMTFYNSIDFYVINYKENSYNNYQQIQLNTTALLTETAVRISSSSFRYAGSMKTTGRFSAAANAFENGKSFEISAFHFCQENVKQKR